MRKPLWAPWRLEYITQADDQEDCVFCLEATATPGAEGSLLVRDGVHAVALLNRYPYSSGHVMVAPKRHVAALSELTEQEVVEIHGLSVAAMDALEQLSDPGGFNLGWNLGRAAGAGITDHLHLHVVPRWTGDTNFMPVLADVKVVPEHLVVTRDRLLEAWPSG